MLQGYDFSHHNSDKQVSDRYRSADFLCHKLTEGISYTDPTARARAGLWRGEKPIFWYHLVRPDKGNTPAAEASHFITKIATIEEYGPFGLALDLEHAYVPYGSNYLGWLIELIRKIKSAYNKPILVYMGDLYPDNWYEEIRSAGGAIWIARWGNHPTHKYEVWQDTDRYEGEKLDHDISPLTETQMWELIGDGHVDMSMEEACELALGVVQGKYGIGMERKRILGEKYDKVQRIVNFIHKEVNNR